MKQPLFESLFQQLLGCVTLTSFISLSFCFLICEMEIMTVLASLGMLWGQNETTESSQHWSWHIIHT